MSLRWVGEGLEAGQDFWQVADMEGVLCGELPQAFIVGYTIQELC